MSNDLLLISNPCHMQVAGKRHNPCKIATWTGYSNQSINLSNSWTSIKQTVIEKFIYYSMNAFSEKNIYYFHLFSINYAIQTFQYKHLIDRNYNNRHFIMCDMYRIALRK